MIPVFNEERTLPRCLDSLEHLDRDDVEVIFVDDGSTDRSRELLERSPFTVITGEHRGPSAARNRGIAEARGELVAFTDADCIVPSRWLSALVEALDDSGASAAGGGQHSPDDESPTGRAFQRTLAQLGFVADYVKSGEARRRVAHNASCNALYRKDALLAVDGFREDLYPGEDVDLDHRLAREGHWFVFAPGASVAHYRPDTLRGCWRMMQRYGEVQAKLVLLHGPFRPLHALPALTALGTALGIAAPPAAAAAGLVLYAGCCLRARALVRPDLMALVATAWHAGFYSELVRGVLARLLSSNNTTQELLRGTN